MDLTDFIVNLLQRILRAQELKKEDVCVIYNKTSLDIIKILMLKGYIYDYNVLKVQGKLFSIKVRLKYSKKREPLIKDIVLRGTRDYCMASKCLLNVIRSKVDKGERVSFIMSTGEGIMADRIMIKKNLFGLMLCEIHIRK
jgi:ribosomal protein S8